MADSTWWPAAPRPPRGYVRKLSTIAKYHGLGPVAKCVRCGWIDGEGFWDESCIERAHIIDRAHGGLDGVQNVVPLCSYCHARQPVFKSGEEAAAREWFGLSPVEPVPVRSAEPAVAVVADRAGRVLVDSESSVVVERTAYLSLDGAGLPPPPPSLNREAASALLRVLVAARARKAATT